MPNQEIKCEHCGMVVVRYVRSDRKPQRYCSQRCWLAVHNNPERNARVARESAEKRGNTLRGTGSGWTRYTKRGGKHEHRKIMEEELGRTLGSNEIVHHHDNKGTNNERENLELTTRSEHTRYHNKQRHAKQKEGS